jgi:hypothetical protein
MIKILVVLNSQFFLTDFENIKVPPGYMKMFNKTSIGRPY